MSKYFGAIWIVFAVTSVAILNSWAGWDGVPENTISAWATLWGESTNAVPFFYGAVGGHWASRRWKSWHVSGGPLPLVACCVMLGLFDFLTGGIVARWWPSFAVFLVVGGVSGALLWPMHDEEVG
jgi:hypothetical protein